MEPIAAAILLGIVGYAYLDAQFTKLHDEIKKLRKELE